MVSFFTVTHDWMYRVHGRWFPMPVEQFNAIHCGSMAIFKCDILIFNLVPYLVIADSDLNTKEVFR